MVALRDAAEYALNALREAGFDSSEVSSIRAAKEEINLNAGEVNLLRTVEETSISLTGIMTHRRASVTIGEISEESVDAAVESLVQLAGFSEHDVAFEVSPFQEPKQFQRGEEQSDTHLMLKRLDDFRLYTQKEHPELILRRATVTFHSVMKQYLNSNGVDFSSRSGHYTVLVLFASRMGSSSSSSNSASFTAAMLDRPIHEFGNLERLLRQSTEQVNARKFEGKFTGSVILTPECLNGFLEDLCFLLRDQALIMGTSIFQGSLGRPIADNSFTLHSMPVCSLLSEGCPITDDGFAAQNTTLIESGILESFLLSLYGSRKTGFPRAGSSGGYLVVNSGNTTLEKMVESVDRGVLLSRFSGGGISADGDFSGVAKNSYYIENGKMIHPVSGMLVSGNMRDLLMRIRSISSERTNFGFALLPWMLAEGVTVSGGSDAS